MKELEAIQVAGTIYAALVIFALLFPVGSPTL